MSGEIQREKVRDEETARPPVYIKAKQSFRAKPMALQQSAPAKSFSSGNTAKIALDYAVGDTVKHSRFGEGIVKQIIEGGRDYEVTVDFQTAGVKKMFASFAKLKKL